MPKENLLLLFSVPLWSFQIEDLVGANKILLDAVFEKKKVDAGVDFYTRAGGRAKGNYSKSQNSAYLSILLTNVYLRCIQSKKIH